MVDVLQGKEVKLHLEIMGFYMGKPFVNGFPLRSWCRAMIPVSFRRCSSSDLFPTYSKASVGSCLAAIRSMDPSVHAGWCGGCGLVTTHNSKSESLEKYLLYAGCTLVSVFASVKLSLTQSATSSSLGFICMCISWSARASRGQVVKNCLKMN